MRYLWLVTALLFIDCKKPETEGANPPAPEPAMAPSQPSPQTPPAEPPGAQRPAPEPSAAPVPATASAPEAAPATQPAQTAETGAVFEAPRAGGLTWKDGKGLVRRVPKSSMRAAEYGVAGDEQTELSVFYFGEGQGGAVEPNVARWLGQFKQADGSDTASKAKRSTSKVHGIDVTIVQATGAYSGGMGMPGAAPAAVQPDAMLLGAIASGPKGPVFFKLTGPRTTLLRVRPGFDAMIKSLRTE